MTDKTNTPPRVSEQANQQAAPEAPAEPVAEFIADAEAVGGAKFRLLKPLPVGAKLYAAPAPAAQQAGTAVEQHPVAYIHSVDLGKSSAPVYSPEQFRSWPLGKKDNISPYIPLYADPVATTASASGETLDIIEIAARIFDFKPHKQTEETKAKYLRFADAVMAHGRAPALSREAAAMDATKAVYWFGVLEKCARLLDLPNDEPIPSGVLRAVTDLVAQPGAGQAAQAGADETKDAARYRWLRDKSEPGICAFYLSVGQALKGVKFARETVDEAIDAAMSTATASQKGEQA
jgi:hypothetical protein